MKQSSLLNWIAAALYLVAMIGVPAGTFAIAVAGDTPVVMAQDDAADDSGPIILLVLFTASFSLAFPSLWSRLVSNTFLLCVSALMFRKI